MIPLTSLDKSMQEIIKKFNKSSSKINLEAFYSRKSMLEIAGFSRNEQAHSNFIAWILDENESHGLEKMPFISFLKIIEEQLLLLKDTKKKYTDDEKSFKNLKISKKKISNISVLTEKPGELGRPDIVIEFFFEQESNSDKKIRIILENKVCARETGDQTVRYYKEFITNKEKDKVDLNIFVYLTPISTQELLDQDKSICSCEDFLVMNYQLMTDHVFSMALEQAKRTKLKKTISILDDYIKSLSIISHKKNCRFNIMAIGKKESKLLEEFWNENGELLSSVCESTILDQNQNTVANEKAVQVSTQTTRVNRRWDVSGRLRDIYNTMTKDDTIKWSDLIKKVQESYQLLVNESPGYQAVSTPLMRNTVNHPSRKSAGVKNPFPAGNSLFYIARSKGRTKYLKKFVPHEGVEKIDIYWDEGKEVCSKKPFGEIEDNMDKENYPDWNK